MFYASMSLLGFSVIFVIWYYAVKAVKEGQKQRRAKARRGRGGQGLQRGRGRGQPDMRLRMNAMLEKIKRDFA